MWNVREESKGQKSTHKKIKSQLFIVTAWLQTTYLGYSGVTCPSADFDSDKNGGNEEWS